MRKLVALCLLLALPAASQDLRLGETIEISIVNVDVIVTDRSGKHVRGVPKEAFEIYEGGKLQTITNFAEYASSGTATAMVPARPLTPDASAPARASAPEPAAQPQRRNVVVFVDDLRVFGRERQKLFDGVKQFLRRTIRPGDAAAIAGWSKAPRTLQDFTDNLPALEKAIDGLAAEPGKVEGSEWNVIDTERYHVEAYYASAGSGDVGTVSSQLDAAARVALDVQNKARTLESLMNAIAGADGQKIVLMLSSRFSPSAGSEYLQGANRGERNAVLSAGQYIDRMMRTAKANGIRVYPILSRIGDLDINDSAANQKPVGLAGMQQHALSRAETMSLSNIAVETGGVAGTGLGDLDKVLTSASEDLDSYYSLAYRAAEGRSDRPQKLVVRLKNGDYRVRVRKDIVHRSDDTLARQRVLASLLEGPRTTGIPVHVFVGKAKVEKGMLHLPLKVRVPLSALTLLSDGSAKVSGGFTVYVAWGGAFGAFGDVTKSSFPVSVDAAKAKEGHVTYEVTVATARNVDRLAVAVVDDVGRETGLVRFDVPKPNAPPTASARP